MSLQRHQSAIVWDLRTAWGTRRRVVLTLTARCEVQRIEGKVDRVSTTDALVEIGGWVVPVEDVLAVTKPHHTQRARKKA